MCSNSGYCSYLECLEEYEIYPIAAVFSEICSSSCLGCSFSSLLFSFCSESMVAHTIHHQLGWGLGEPVTLQLCCCHISIAKYSGRNTIFPSTIEKKVGALKYANHHPFYVVGSGEKD